MTEPYPDVDPSWPAEREAFVDRHVICGPRPGAIEELEAKIEAIVNEFTARAEAFRATGTYTPPGPSLLNDFERARSKKRVADRAKAGATNAAIAERRRKLRSYNP